MTERKAVIKNADMSEDMQQDAVDCASQALEKYNIEKVQIISVYIYINNAIYIYMCAHYLILYIYRILLLISRRSLIRNITLLGIVWLEETSGLM